MNVLEITDLCKHYPSFDLNNVSFQVKRGEIAGFIGINGSGKTTTIKCLLNLIHKDKGQMKIFGLDYDSDEIEIKNRIGVVLDNDYFFQNFTMDEMKDIVAMAYSKWDDDQYKHYMKNFSLSGKQKIKSLSKGMKMKYALTLALSHHAELLVMDEPASGLDPLVRDELDDILLDYVKDGEHSVFFSTHITSDLDKSADHIIFLNKGRVLLDIPKKELINKYVKVNGKLSSMTKEISEKLITTTYTGDEFSGIIENEALPKLAGLNVSKPSIEDIMIGYLKERDEHESIA